MCCIGALYRCQNNYFFMQVPINFIIFTRLFWKMCPFIHNIHPHDPHELGRKTNTYVVFMMLPSYYNTTLYDSWVLTNSWLYSNEWINNERNWTNFIQFLSCLSNICSCSTSSPVRPASAQESIHFCDLREIDILMK